MSVSNYWPNFHFWVNYPFKIHWIKYSILSQHQYTIQNVTKGTQRFHKDKGFVSFRNKVFCSCHRWCRQLNLHVDYEQALWSISVCTALTLTGTRCGQNWLWLDDPDTHTDAHMPKRWPIKSMRLAEQQRVCMCGGCSRLAQGRGWTGAIVDGNKRGRHRPASQRMAWSLGQAGI